MIVGGSFGTIKMIWLIWRQIRSRRFERRQQRGVAPALSAPSRVADFLLSGNVNPSTRAGHLKMRQWMMSLLTEGVLFDSFQRSSLSGLSVVTSGSSASTGLSSSRSCSTLTTGVTRLSTSSLSSNLASFTPYWGLSSSCLFSFLPVSCPAISSYHVSRRFNIYLFVQSIFY